MSDTRVYDVPEISCDHCKESIEGALDGVAGVDRAQVDVEARTVTVAGDVDDAVVRSSLEDIGYDVAGVR